MYLPNSPGADPLYQKLHKIKWIKGYTIDKGFYIPDVHSLKDVYQAVKNSPGLLPYTKESTLVYSTSTMSFAEMMAVHMIQTCLQNATREHGPLGNVKEFPKMFQQFKELSLIAAQQQFQEIDPLIQEYGFVLFGSYMPKEHKIHYRWVP
jgi:hypothetical protein